MSKGNDLLFYAVVAGTILVFSWIKLGPRIRRRLSTLEREKPPVVDILRWALSSRECGRRLLITLGILLLVYLAGLCPLPGFNPWPTTGIGGDLLTRLSLFDIGIPERSFSILALGLGPFYSACILVQIVFLLVKPWRPHLFNGGKHRVTLVRATVVVTLVLTVLQAVGIMVGMDQQGFLLQGWQYGVAAMATLVGGTFFYLTMAYLITRYGIGHGFGLLFLVTFFEKIIEVNSHSTAGVVPLWFFLGLMVAAGIAWFVTHLKLEIPVAGKNSDHSFSLPVRPTWLGTEPHQWGFFFLLFPATLSQFFWSQKMTELLMMVSTRGISQVVHAILIVLISFVYVSLLFRPTHIINRLQTHGFSVLSPDKDPNRLLVRKGRGIMVISVIILLAFGYLINGLTELVGWSHSSANLFGLSGILVAVGVLADLLARLRFLKERETVGKCILVYTAADEIEATIKKEFLKNNGVTALIEPLRFTWGMPIRTMVDEYRIHVQQKDTERAATLLQKINY